MCELDGGPWKTIHWLINYFTRILLGWNLNVVQQRHSLVIFSTYCDRFSNTNLGMRTYTVLSGVANIICGVRVGHR